MKPIINTHRTDYHLNAGSSDAVKLLQSGSLNRTAHLNRLVTVGLFTGMEVLVTLQHTGLKSYQPFDFQQNVSETTHVYFKYTANIHAFLV